MPETSASLIWRAMTSGDAAIVAAIAGAVHPDFPEDPAVVAERLALAPGGCFVLDGPGGPAGYAVSHPWTLGRPPALDALLGALPAHPTTWYIHDVALMPVARGAGAAAAIVARLVACARAAALPTLSLVAVNNSSPFWSRHGFRIADDPALARKLATYGPDARFMARDAG